MTTGAGPIGPSSQRHIGWCGCEAVPGVVHRHNLARRGGRIKDGVRHGATVIAGEDIVRIWVDWRAVALSLVALR